MFKRNFFRPLMLVAFAAVLSACGSDLEIVDDNVNTPTPTGPVASSLTLLLSSPQLTSDGDTVTKGVTLTAVLKDASNRIVSGVPVDFSTDTGSITLGPSAVSDGNGRATATLDTGGDPTNRTITVTCTAGEAPNLLTRTATVRVVGTTLSFTSGPDSTQISTPTDYTVILTDASGKGIGDRTVTLSSNPGNTVTPASQQTDGNGQAKFSLSATQASTTLTATALGLTATKNVTVSTDDFRFSSPAINTEINISTVQTVTVRWREGGANVPDGRVVTFTATRGRFASSAADAVPGDDVTTFDATTAGGVATVFLRSSESGFTTVVASSNQGNRPSTSITYEFVATTPSKIDVQASPAVIGTNQTSDITAIVRDANNNLVKNVALEFSLQDITGGTLTSPTALTNSQGLAKISYNSTTQASSKDGVVITGVIRGTVIDDDALITVGNSATRIAIGTGAEIIEKDESTYQLPFTVQITDSAGNPVSDADFTLSVEPSRYLKGLRSSPTPVCVNEDANRNGVLDPGEDSNGNGRLDPDTGGSVPRTVALDPDGTAQFFLTYPKDRADFIEVVITGVARVAGTESTTKRTLVLPSDIDDADNLPPASPFGTASTCANPN